MSDAPRLNAVEQRVVDLLGNAWNTFLRLPHVGPDDLVMFRQGIHALQDQVLARPMRLDLAKVRRQETIDPDLEREAAALADGLGFNTEDTP